MTIRSADFYRSLLLIHVICFAGALLRADSVETKERTVTKLAEGVYEIRHPDSPDTFPQGNTTVIIGERGVLVVDSCLLPSSTRLDIEQIRKWTSKPVIYVLNTHWHFDHTLGNATYAEAFPAVQIIAQVATRKIIADWNPGAVNRYPSRGERFKKILESGKNADGTPLTATDRADYERSLAGLGSVLAEFKGVTQLVPNVSFEKELNVDLGDRLIQIRHVGRGNTAGDTIAYLPKEKILMTGDLLDHPVPYLFGGFPVDFVDTLHTLLQFEMETIVPGHGDLQHDKSYMQQTVDLIQTVNTEVEKEINQGKTLEEVQAEAPKNLDMKGWREKFLGSNTDDASFFNESFEGLVKASYTQIKTR